MTVDELLAYLKQHKLETGKQLRNGTYKPQPVWKSGNRLAAERASLAFPLLWSRSIGLPQMVKEITTCLRGWLGYFCDCQTPQRVQSLET